METSSSSHWRTRPVAVPAALAVVAVAVIGCSQPSGNPTGAAGPVRTQGQATSASSAPSVEASVAGTARGDAAITSPPVEFTGRIICGPPVRTGVDERPADGGAVHVRSRGWAWQPTATMSDPRLEGDYYISEDTDEYRSPAGTSVGSGTWRIENEEGAWQGSYTNIFYPDSTTTVSTALVGERAYEGLTALWESTFHGPSECSWDVRGLIFEGDAPAAPEPYLGQ